MAASPKCRCYINLKYYAKVVSKGAGTLRGCKPCPIHDLEALARPWPGGEEQMANMSYCRFQNTVPDLRDCYQNWDDVDPDNEDELKAQKRLLSLCLTIVTDYGPEEIQKALAQAEAVVEAQG